MSYETASAAADLIRSKYKGDLRTAIVLGSGGDCCKPDGGANQSVGTFYEGCIVTGYPSDATEDAVQANVLAAGYGK